MTTLVQGDTASVLNGTITDEETNGPLNLTGATVFFQMRKPDDRRYTINGACSIVSPTAGTVRYAVAANDLNTAGEYQAQFEVHFADTTILTTAPLIPITVRRQ